MFDQENGKSAETVRELDREELEVVWGGGDPDMYDDGNNGNG